MERIPTTELTPFSGEDAVPTAWERGREVLRDAELYWVTTVRPDGRPHVTPLIGVWWEGALHFTTGATERKARNLAADPHCALTTGVNSLADGLDVVVEGEAVHVTDAGERAGVADAFVAKYGRHFAPPDGTWAGLDDMIRDGNVLLYRVAPVKAFGFGKGTTYSETRWRF
jgi:nitroimidazol reductase NimA-like FMN-containing flavoprotein (pyridoxamine 5'-phosphate oxidase superfamily)